MQHLISSNATSLLQRHNTIITLSKRWRGKIITRRGGPEWGFGSKVWKPAHAKCNEQEPTWNQAIITTSPLKSPRMNRDVLLASREPIAINIKKIEPPSIMEPFQRPYLESKTYNGGNESLKGFVRHELDANNIPEEPTKQTPLNELEFELKSKLRMNNFPNYSIIQMVTDRNYLDGVVPSNDRLVYLGNTFLESYGVMRAVKDTDSLDSLSLGPSLSLLNIPNLVNVAVEKLNLHNILRYSKDGKWVDLNVNDSEVQTALAKCVLSITGAIYHLEGPYLAEFFVRQWILSEEL